MYIQVLVLVTTWLAYPSWQSCSISSIASQQGIVLNFHLLNSHDEWMVQVIVKHIIRFEVMLGEIDLRSRELTVRPWK